MMLSPITTVTLLDLNNPYDWTGSGQLSIDLWCDPDQPDLGWLLANDVTPGNSLKILSVRQPGTYKLTYHVTYTNTAPGAYIGAGGVACPLPVTTVQTSVTGSEDYEVTQAQITANEGVTGRIGGWIIANVVLPANGTVDIQSVTLTIGRYVASAVTILASSAGDGSFWRSVDQGVIFVAHDGHHIQDADYAHGRWIAGIDTYDQVDGVWGYVPMETSLDDGLTWQLMMLGHQVDATGAATPGVTDLDPNQISVAYAVRWNGSYWLAGGAKAYPAPNDAPCIAKSVDGITWTMVNSPALHNTEAGLDAATKCWELVWSGAFWIGRFSSPEGAGSYFLASSPDGEVWTRCQLPAGYTEAGDLRYPMCMGNSILFAGYDATTSNSTVFVTADGGNSWTTTAQLPFSRQPLFVDYAPGLDVLLTGWDAGTTDHLMTLARSTDGGATWSVNDSPVGVPQGYYTGKLCIWDGQRFYLGGRDFATSGGGASRFASSVDGLIWSSTTTSTAQEFAVLTTPIRPDLHPGRVPLKVLAAASTRVIFE